MKSISSYFTSVTIYRPAKPTSLKTENFKDYFFSGYVLIQKQIFGTYATSQRRRHRFVLFPIKSAACLCALFVSIRKISSI
jgi:hypothetical protein